MWNRVASERVRRFGFTPAEGDLVLVGEDHKVRFPLPLRARLVARAALPPHSGGG